MHKITPASTDPAVATTFAIECKNHGVGVVQVISEETLKAKGIAIKGGNYLKSFEAEVGVSVAPLEFARSANYTIPVSVSRQILKDMGIYISARFGNTTSMGKFIRATPKLNKAQIIEYISRVKKYQKGEN